MTIMGEGKNPTQNHLLRLAGVGNISQDRALEIIEQVLEATRKWGYFAEKAGVSKLHTKNIASALS
jgi:serine/threonine-protein kinase HipA